MPVVTMISGHQAFVDTFTWIDLAYSIVHFVLLHAAHAFLSADCAKFLSMHLASLCSRG